MRLRKGEGKHEEQSLGILYQEYKLRKLSKVEKQQEMSRLLLPIGRSSVTSSLQWLGERTVDVTDESLPRG